jgi:competence protein ComEC
VVGVASITWRAQAWAAKGDLQIYFIDVEGGQATLFMTPVGQSLLIDTGWPDNAGRDAARIFVVTKSRVSIRLTCSVDALSR